MRSEWIGVAVAGGLAAFDLALFAWVGLDVAGLATTLAGVMTLGSFVVGYAALGYVGGRLWTARQRARADKARIQAQLEALEEGRARLAQAEKLAALGRLAAGIAHEVRNPLGVIRASASMVQEAFDRGTDDHRACDLIRDEIDRLDGLIAALLTFAKPTRMSLGETAVEPVVARAATLAAEARAALSVKTDVRAGAVRADADLLTQVLLGLVVNAAEAGAATVEIRATEEGDALRLEVADDGPGVAEEDVPTLFEPFFTTKDTGTGLGLSMALRIVEAHGGTLDVDAKGGLAGGARFVLSLPAGGPAQRVEAA